MTTGELFVPLFTLFTLSLLSKIVCSLCCFQTTCNEMANDLQPSARPSTSTDQRLSKLDTRFSRLLRHLLASFLKGVKQPRPQGLLLDDFQNGGSSAEDPGTQQKSRDRFVHGGWKFIQNGGQDKQ